MYDITSYSLVTPPYSGVSGYASIQLHILSSQPM